MDDTKSLLMMVLHKIFENDPKIVEDTFQLIHHFNNGKIEKKNYEQTLRAICDLLNDELPSPILVYVLTLVDMPKEELDTAHSQIIEKMRKTQEHFPETNVRPYLLKYLNNIKQTHPPQDPKPEIPTPAPAPPVTKTEPEEKKDSHSFIKPMDVVKPIKTMSRTRKTTQKSTETLKSLLDICATYVVVNEKKLNEMYKSKQKSVWKLINSNKYSGKKLQQCYDVVKDLNKKNRWLREIGSEITMETMMEEYQNSDILWRNNMEVQDDLFEMSVECRNAIDALFPIE